MSRSIKTIVLDEFREKRRKAENDAYKFKADMYMQLPELLEYDRKISNIATEYTKRMISGENVREQMSEQLAAVSTQKNNFLKEHGLSISDFEPHYSCDICKDTGFTDGKMCGCLKKRIIEENFKSSNIGDSLSYQNFDAFNFDFYSKEKIEGYPISPYENMQNNFKKCQSFADNFAETSKSLLLLGSTGLGKTFLSTCIAGRLLDRGNSVIYISAVDFFKRIEKARFDSDNSDVSLFESCDLLIIDDLGTEAPSVYTVAVFSDILDKRIRTSKKMILSSNNRFPEFEKLYGERVFSRLAGSFDCLLFYGKDIRIQKFLNKE